MRIATSQKRHHYERHVPSTHSPLRQLIGATETSVGGITTMKLGVVTGSILLLCPHSFNVGNVTTSSSLIRSGTMANQNGDHLTSHHSNSCLHQNDSNKRQAMRANLSTDGHLPPSEREQLIPSDKRWKPPGPQGRTVTTPRGTSIRTFNKSHRAHGQHRDDVANQLPHTGRSCPAPSPDRNQRGLLSS